MKPTVNVTRSAYEKLKARARREGITVAELIERLINVALDEEMRLS